MIRMALVAAALVALTSAAAGSGRALSRTHTPPPAFCSLDALGGFGYELATLFIATATADSLPGGKPRRVRATMFRDDSVTLQAPAYSQVVRIERLTQTAGSALKKAIQKNGGRVLLIPWEHGPDCGPGSWTGETLWLKPGTRGLFGAILRPKEQWVNGVPTFDVGTPYYLPYPSGQAFASVRREGNALSADELMSFFDALPRLPAQPPDHRTRLKREQTRNLAVLRWAARHPELRNQPPVARIITTAGWASRRSSYFLRESPLAGTWRFTVIVPPADTAVIYGRTQELPTGLLEDRGGSIRDVPGDSVFGYNLYMLTGQTESELDIDPGTFNMRGGFIGASFQPEVITPDSTVWSAGVEILSEGVFPATSRLGKHMPFLRKNAQHSIDADRPRHAPGRAVLRRDGSLELSVAYGSEGRTLVEIRGERISKSLWAQH